MVKVTISIGIHGLYKRCVVVMTWGPKSWYKLKQYTWKTKTKQKENP